MMSFLVFEFRPATGCCKASMAQVVNAVVYQSICE